MSQEADDDCVCKDMDEYMGKSLRFCAVKCLSDGQIQNVTQSALSIIQDLLIQYIKEIGTRAKKFREEEEEEEEEEDEEESVGSHTRSDTDVIIHSMGNMMVPVVWDAASSTTAALISGWRQDRHRFDYRVKNYVNRIIVNSHALSGSYKPIREYVAAQEQAIAEAEAQVESTGRRFRHKFPHVPQFPPPITYGTTPGSIKRAETAALMAERPKKKSKTKRSSQKKSSSSSNNNNASDSNSSNDTKSINETNETNDNAEKVVVKEEGI